MFTIFPARPTPGAKQDILQARSNDALPRDKGQSQHLHEPTLRSSHIDPMTGADIDNLEGHPSLVDGNLTMHFETEETRKEYQELPINHPIETLPYPVSEDDDRGG
jgi:hypothetical protein